MSRNKVKKVNIIRNAALIIITAITLCGCSLEEATDTFSNLLGFGSSSPETGTKAEIEYYESGLLNITPSPQANENHAETEQEAGSEAGTLDEATVDNEEPSVEERPVQEIPGGKNYARKAGRDGEVSISFAGDFCLTEGCSVLGYAQRHDMDMKNSFDESLFGRMVNSDIFMLNNEYPYSSRGAKLEDKMYTFRAAPESVQLLSTFGVDIVSLANNHVYDYGPQALSDTLTILEEAGIPYVGAGNNIEEAMQPAYFHIDGKIVAIIAATQIEGYENPETKEATENSPGVLRCLNTARIQTVIEQAKENSDFVICFIHWGTEHMAEVRDWQRNNARAMVESGADLIVGAHTHCLQGIEYVEGVPVVYGMGNYLFNSNTQDTCLITLTLDTSCADSVDIKNLKFVPCIQSGGQTVEANGNEWNRIIQYENSISSSASIDYEGNVSPK